MQKRLFPQYDPSLGSSDYASLHTQFRRVSVVALIWFLSSLFADVSLLGLRGGTFVGVQTVRAADISYIYDELGRLRAVIDPASDTAVYNYDAVGNLLSITRQISTAVSIIEFTPDSGPVGTTVTIYGTGFSTTPSQNTVTFNGVSANVTSSTTTQIVTTVSAGATTGVIGVTTPGGSATSAEVFTVAASSAPTITGFTPTVGTAGTPVTITGTNFSTTLADNDLRFNARRAVVSSSTTTSIATTVPSATGSGRISVTTPFGTAVSSNDFFIPPSPYTASDVDYTGRMSVDGASHTVTISTPNKIGLVVFDGTAGQIVSLGINSYTLASLSDLAVYNPDGTTLAFNGAFTLSTNFHMVLPITGTYTIMVDPNSTSTGNEPLSNSG